MLRELLRLLRGSDPLKEMYDGLVGMIEKTGRMFDSAWEGAAAGRSQPEVRDEVGKIDIEVNKSERQIRRKLAEHLVLRSGQDAPTCLVLMSIVKDAERVGDYCKDILDAAAMETKPLCEGAHFAEYESVYRDTRVLFEKLQQALVRSDRSLAENVMLLERSVRSRCEALLAKLATEDEPSRIGVPWALIARYLRRTAAHLSNVASSLVMPLDKIDYHDEKWLKRDEIARGDEEDQ